MPCSDDAPPPVQKARNGLPSGEDDQMAVRTTLDPATLLPADRVCSTCSSSPATLPCSEGVLRRVMQQPVTLAVAQIAIFVRLSPMDARPIRQSDWTAGSGSAGSISRRRPVRRAACASAPR